MATVIAEIRLAPGEVGYYDDYSRIYLNAGRPTAKIYAGMNTTQIRRSIRSGRLLLISGSLNAPAEQPKAETPVKKQEKPAAPAKQVKEEPMPEPEIVNKEKTETEPVISSETVENIEEIPTEQTPAEEEPATKPKRRSRRKQAEAE